MSCILLYPYCIIILLYSMGILLYSMGITICRHSVKVYIILCAYVCMSERVWVRIMCVCMQMNSVTIIICINHP